MLLQFFGRVFLASKTT